jgi:hypothetical protein
MNPFYDWFYKHYWWLLLTLFAFSFALPLAMGALKEPVRVTALLAAHVAAFYFAQRQRLADQRVSAELLVSLNGRYAWLLPQLQAVLEENDGEALGPEQRVVLASFFDLCGEIHGFHQARQIDPAQWRMWLRRMRMYYYHPRVRKFWDAQIKKNIYVGLDGHLLK